jgi:hypothetical protein
MLVDVMLVVVALVEVTLVSVAEVDVSVAVVDVRVTVIDVPVAVVVDTVLVLAQPAKLPVLLASIISPISATAAAHVVPATPCTTIVVPTHEAVNETVGAYWPIATTMASTTASHEETDAALKTWAPLNAKVLAHSTNGVEVPPEVARAGSHTPKSDES